MLRGKRLGQTREDCCLQALRRNPWAPGVPCHRVVAANLELGGFDGDWVSREPPHACILGIVILSEPFQTPPLCMTLKLLHASMQGLHTPKVKSKRALLVEEGVHFLGNRIQPSCVLDADELLAAVKSTTVHADAV